MNRRMLVGLALVSFSSTISLATAPPAGSADVMNCVDGTKTVDPSGYVDAVIREWRSGSSFAGVDIYNLSRADEFAEAFFNGNMPMSRAYVVQHPKEILLIRSPDGKKACMVMFGEI